jgi:MFS family permease
MTLEHAPANRRAFFSSFTLAGTQGGSILATAIFIPIAAMAPDSLLSWGWRIPFLLSAVVMVVGWWIRRTLHETPAFEEEEVHHVVPKAPLKALFRNYTADVLKVMLCALVSVVGTIFGIYTLTYGVNTMGLSRTSLLWMQILANVVALGAIPLWALVGDRIGRKPVFFIGALGTAALVWPFIWAISEKNLPLVFVIGILLSGVVYSAYGGVGFALFSEQFDTKVRMSGMAVGTQFGFAIGGFAPTIAALLAGPTLENWVPVAIFGCVAAVIASISALTMRETYQVHMNDLGKPRKAARSTVSV